MEIVYNEARGTYNLFDGAEWYAEGTYEQMETMLDNHRQCEAEEYEEEDVPSDYYGDFEDYDD
jgi:hypothetical protein